MKKLLFSMIILVATPSFAHDYGASTGDGYHDAPGMVISRTFDKAFALQFKPGMTRTQVEAVVGVAAKNIDDYQGDITAGWMGANGTQFEIYVSKKTGKITGWLVTGLHNNVWLMEPGGKIRKSV
jgi:hypothetical protein